MNNALRTALLVMISVVWAVNFTAPLIEHNYKPPPEVNMAFMGVVGYLTATYQRKGSDEKK